jgi:HK97 family phage prohead protease
MLVRKQISLTDVELKTDGDKGTFEGYASRFGGVDSYGDTIAKGAFSESIGKHGFPKMFFEHSWDMPIGRYTKCAEDESGLYVAGEFTPGLMRAADVRAAMMHGTIDGLSVGGFVKGSDREEKKDGGSLIKRFSRLVEVSPVVFPADASARIATVRGEDVSEVIADLETISDFERLLRDAGGFSKGLATALASRAKVIFGPGGNPVSKHAEASARALDEQIKRIRKLTGG